MTLSRETGKIKLVENGRVYADKYSQDIVKFMNKIQLQVCKRLALDTRKHAVLSTNFSTVLKHKIDAKDIMNSKFF